MKLVINIVLLSVTLLAVSASVPAQNKRSRRIQQSQNERAKAADQLAKSRDDLIKATKDYKASLEQLITIYEGNVQKAKERLTQSKGLFAGGVLSKRELDGSERAVADARAKVVQLRQQVASADKLIADTLVEARTAEQLAKAPPLPAGGLVRTTSYIRYNGPGLWSLSDAWKVQRFFTEKFGRQLPVSAFGQSAVHDRWGLDHHNAMDVGVNPDSAEGQALMAFLRSNGIPFLAFRYPITGSATGPHIHIGRPSHRLTSAPSFGRLP